MRKLHKLPILLTLLTVASCGFASVTVSSPSNGATVQSPVKFVANAGLRSGITGMAIYVDSKEVYSTRSASLSTSVAMSSGQHAIVVKASSNAGRAFSDSLTIQVLAATAPTPAPTPLSITTTSLPGATAGTAYSTTLGAQGGTSPYKWSLASDSCQRG